MHSLSLPSKRRQPGVIDRDVTPVHWTARGQAMVEFAVVAPLLLMLLFGVFEGSLLMFSNGSAHFGAGEVARVLAEEGSRPTADQDAVGYLRDNTFLGQTAIATVIEVDIYRVIRDPSTGRLKKDPVLAPNRYQLNGTLVPATSVNWISTSRDISAYGGDYVGVDVLYRYSWKSGIFTAAFGPGVSGAATVWVRLEPQVY